MKKLVKSVIVFLCFLGFSMYSIAQNVGDIDNASNSGFREKKDELRDMTFARPLRNSDYDQWQYLVNLRESFEQEIKSVQGFQVPVQQVRNYCASDTDSYTCKKEDLVISVDTRMSAAIRGWQNAILVINDIEKTRSEGVEGNSRSQELQRINVLMNDIDRYNENAKKEFNQASVEMVEFQDQNPLLFTSGN